MSYSGRDERREALRTAVKGAVDEIGEELITLSHAIHDNPELEFEEYKAAQGQADLLAKHGFAVQKPYCDLKTAYRATVRLGSQEAKVPRIAFLAEYDALPGYGHACGHNIIAATAVGAGIALKNALGERNVPVDINVIGTPAEEGGRGKVYLN